VEAAASIGQPLLQPRVAGDVEALLAELLHAAAMTSSISAGSMPVRSMSSV
jgi:hypothetical protein